MDNYNFQGHQRSLASIPLINLHHSQKKIKEAFFEASREKNQIPSILLLLIMKTNLIKPTITYPV